MASVEGAAATADPSETDRATGEDATVDEVAMIGLVLICLVVA